MSERPYSPRLTRTAGLRLVAQAAIWGSSFTFITRVGTSMSPSALVLSRLGLATLVLLAATRWRGERLVRGWPAWRHTIVGAGLANVAPYLLLTYGERSTTAAVAGVLVGATPLVTVVLGMLALRAERVSRSMAAGFVIAFLGVVLVVDPFSGDAGTMAGAALCLAAATSYAAGYVWARRFQTTTTTPLGAAASQLLAATAIQALAIPLLGWHVGAITVSSLSAILILGLLATGVGTILYFQLIADVGAGLAASVDYLVPVFAVGFGAAMAGEPITATIAAGTSLILAGMGVSEKGSPRLPRPVLAVRRAACEITSRDRRTADRSRRARTRARARTAPRSPAAPACADS